MRQRGYSQLIDLLNKVRTASLDESDERFIKNTVDALHIYAENKPCETHNSNMLNANGNIFHSVHAIDDLPKNIPKDIIEKARQHNQSQTGSLAQLLEIIVNARVMLTINVDVADCLINGQIGTVKHIVQNFINTILYIYMHIDDNILRVPENVN